MHESDAINELTYLVHRYEKVKSRKALNKYRSLILHKLRHVSIPVKYIFFRKLYLYYHFSKYINKNSRLLKDIAKWKGMKL